MYSLSDELFVDELFTNWFPSDRILNIHTNKRKAETSEISPRPVKHRKRSTRSAPRNRKPSNVYTIPNYPYHVPIMAAFLYCASKGIGVNISVNDFNTTTFAIKITDFSYLVESLKEM